MKIVISCLHALYMHMCLCCSDLSTDNLMYLSSEQALADLAYFRQYISDKLQLSGNKWIAFGGSYPGICVYYRLFCVFTSHRNSLRLPALLPRRCMHRCSAALPISLAGYQPLTTIMHFGHQSLSVDVELMQYFELSLTAVQKIYLSGSLDGLIAFIS